MSDSTESQQDLPNSHLEWVLQIHCNKIKIFIQKINSRNKINLLKITKIKDWAPSDTRCGRLVYGKRNKIDMKVKSVCFNLIYKRISDYLPFSEEIPLLWELEARSEHIV